MKKSVNREFINQLNGLSDNSVIPFIDISIKEEGNIPDNVNIVIDGGDVFEGNIDQFKDCFFDNANYGTIKDWARDNNMKVEFQLNKRK